LHRSPGKAVLVTGCDTGFGRLGTSVLDKLGVVVFAGCYSAKSVQELKEVFVGISKRFVSLAICT